MSDVQQSSACPHGVLRRFLCSVCAQLKPVGVVRHVPGCSCETPCSACGRSEVRRPWECASCDNSVGPCAATALEGHCIWCVREAAGIASEPEAARQLERDDLKRAFVTKQNEWNDRREEIERAPPTAFGSRDAENLGGYVTGMQCAIQIIHSRKTSPVEEGT